MKNVKFSNGEMRRGFPLDRKNFQRSDLEFQPNRNGQENDFFPSSILSEDKSEASANSEV